MSMEVKIPSVGESVQEAVLAEWFKADGDKVEKDEPIFVIETDKVTLEVNAEAAGILHIQVAEGETVAIGDTVATIEETEAAAEAPAPPEKKAAAQEKKPEKPAPQEEKPAPKEPAEKLLLSPAVRRLAAQTNADLSKVIPTGPGGRITKGDLILHLENRPPAPSEEKPAPAQDEPVTRKPMTPIRKRIASRLLEARRNTAMLTTFNEIDMGNVMELRGRYKEAFKKKHGVSLGFMSFFTKAVVEALKAWPQVNAFIEDNEMVYHDYYHIGIAVGSERGLVVPVVRHADRLSFAGIEKAIGGYVNKIKEKRLELSDMEGGTFTITNGGVFGSLLSTPILNTPQSGILGMHKIEKRPMAINDQVVIRPMMYVALSYDHRIVDGKEAVSFLVKVKECVENPERIMMEI